MPMMNILLLLLAARLLQYPGNVTGQFTAAPPTCLGDTCTFRCTVTGDMNGITIWRVVGSGECSLVHNTASAPGPCGSGSAFTVTTETGFGTSATSFSSTLSSTAIPTLDGTLVECFGPALSRESGNRVGGSTLQIIGPPSVPTLSCVDLSGDDSGAVNVTVSWTLSGRDSVDSYLINITTNATQSPYEGLLNITTANVTQYELTGFMKGYEYNITVRGVTSNCGGLVGRESEPLIITPQVPVVSSSCNITLLYKSTGKLVHIGCTWNSVSDPFDPGEACPGPSGDITRYQISFHTGTVVYTQSMGPSECTAGICGYTYRPASNLLNGNVPSNYDTVAVVAVNMVGVGAGKTCTEHPISTTNNLLAGEVIEVSSPSDARLDCTFLSGFNGSAHCIVQYGTDPTYMNLPYSVESTETGTAGDTVSVLLREQLNSSTVYYYTVSAVSGDIMLTVQGNFTTPEYGVCNQLQPSLQEWDIALIVTGVLALVVGIVIIITGTVLSFTRRNKKTQCQILYFTPVVIAALFGVALWIAVGVVVSNGNACGASWQHYQNGLIISGFVASIMTIIFTAAAVVWIRVYHKKTNPGCHREPDGSDEVELPSVKEERYSTLQHGPTSPDPPDQTQSKPIPPGVMYADLRPHMPSAGVSPPTIDDNVQYTLLIHDEKMAEQRTLHPAGTHKVNADATYPLQSAQDVAPPIPPKQSSDDVLLLCKFPESRVLQESGRDAPPTCSLKDASQTTTEQSQYAEVETELKYEPKKKEKREG